MKKTLENTENLDVKQAEVTDIIVENADGTVTYDILNAADLAMAWGIDESDIKEVKYVAFNRIDESHPAPRASISIENIEGPFEACGVDLIARNSATNYTNKTITKNITLTGTVSNSYSLSNEIGIDVKSHKSAPQLDLV